MGAISAGIIIDGVIDGTTVGYQVIVYGDMPLEQSYNQDSGACSPDWESIWNEIKDLPSPPSAKLAMLPRIYIKARDLASGEDVTSSINITSVKYNDSAVSWNGGGTAFDILKMVAKGDTKYGLQYNGNDIPCVMFIGNPADSQSNPDNDHVSFSGTVVTNGGQVNFTDLGKDVKIYPELSANTGYTVVLKVPDTYESYIYDKKVSTKRIAKLWHDHSLVNPTNTPHFFKFYDVTGATATQLVNTPGQIVISTTEDDGISVTGNTIEIFPDAVNSMMTLRCDVYAGTPAEPGELIASGLNVIYDTSDEYQTKWTIADTSAFSSGTETVSNQNLSEGPRYSLRKGQKKYLKPTIVDKDGTPVVFATTPTWAFNADSPDDGTDITDMADSNINNHTSGQEYCFIQYSDVIHTGNVKRPVKIHAQTTI